MGVVSSPRPAETSADVASPCFDWTGSVQAVLHMQVLWQRPLRKGHSRQQGGTRYGCDIWSGGTTFEGGLSTAWHAYIYICACAHTHTHTHKDHHRILTSCLTTPDDEGEWDDNGTALGEFEDRNTAVLLQPDVALLTADSKLCDKNSPQVSSLTVETINEHILAVVRLFYRARLLVV